jgi:acetyl-CoA carboxylase biotin carboxyl carrier protein
MAESRKPTSDSRDKIPSPFDVRTIKDLVALMSRHDLSEIDLREGGVRIRLRRGQLAAVTAALPSSPVQPGTVAASASATPAPTPLEEAPKSAKAVHTIKSPTPGTFYASSSPDAEPFVRVGSRVTPTTVVCLIEAMKIFNEITADCAGVVSEILVENQQPVEYGQVLFKVETS